MPFFSVVLLFLHLLHFLAVLLHILIYYKSSDSLHIAVVKRRCMVANVNTVNFLNSLNKVAFLKYFFHLYSNNYLSKDISLIISCCLLE